MKLTISLAVAAAGLSTVVAAQTERDLGSHEHGSATLNIALDEEQVFIELETPWNNLVGFEHAPRTEDQRESVNKALAVLNQPEQLFSFEGTECVVTENLVESNIDSDHDEHEKGHDDDHGDDHADKDGEDHDDKHEDNHDDKDGEGHDDKDGDDHDDEHGEDHDDKDAEDHDDEHGEDHDDEHGEDHDEAEESHSSVLVSYGFKCDNIDRLDSIDVTLFSVFSGFEDLDVQLIGPGGQALAELNPNLTLVDTRQVQ